MRNATTNEESWLFQDYSGALAKTFLAEAAAYRNPRKSGTNEFWDPFCWNKIIACIG